MIRVMRIFYLSKCIRFSSCDVDITVLVHACDRKCGFGEYRGDRDRARTAFVRPGMDLYLGNDSPSFP